MLPDRPTCGIPALFPDYFVGRLIDVPTQLFTASNPICHRPRSLERARAAPLISCLNLTQNSKDGGMCTSCLQISQLCLGAFKIKARDFLDKYTWFPMCHANF
jgi:hypothetical protein